MPVISDNEIAKAALSAGFVGAQLPIAVAVALAESGGNTEATNSNTNGTTDYGLFQINSIHSAQLNAGNWKNATDNARMAKTVFDDRVKWDTSGWKAWSVYNTNRYLMYLPRGNAASTNVGSVVTQQPGNPTAVTIADPAKASFLDTLGLSYTWLRVGYALLGTVMLAIALKMLVSNVSATSAIKSGVSTAAKGAAIL